MSKRDFLSIADLAGEEIIQLLESAICLKRYPMSDTLRGVSIALIFEKPSLRTRVSFDVAMYQLGGHAVYLSQREIGLGEREPVEDVARVLSRFVSGIVARTYSHRTVELLARWASVPVINGLSDQEHPCQALADLMTILEHKKTLHDLVLAYIGDGNNVANSLALAAAQVGLHFVIASPQGYGLSEAILAQATSLARATGATIKQLHEPAEAATRADILYTDVWTSMGQEAERKARNRAFAGYQINRKLASLAKPDTLIMHDLPAHRGEEITDDLINSPQSVIFDQAENRLHVQKALLLRLLTNRATLAATEGSE